MRDNALLPYLPSSSKRERLSLSGITRFFRFLLRYPVQLLATLLFLAIATASTVALPRIIGYLIDKGLIVQNQEVLQTAVLYFVIAELSRVVASGLQVLFAGSLGLRVMHDLRMQLLSKALRLKFAVLDKTSSGQILSRVTQDTAALSQLFTSGVIGILERVVVVSGIVVSLILFNAYLSLIALFLFPLIGIAAIFMSRAMYRYSSLIRELTAATTTFLTETLQGADIVRIFHKQSLQSARFDQLNSQFAVAQRRPQLLNAVFHPGMSVVNGATVALLIWLGGNMVQNNELSVGTLVSFIAYVLWAFWPILHIVNQWSVVVAGISAMERIFEMLDWPEEEGVIHNHHYINRTPWRGEVEFRNVWFAYDEENWVLQDLSFTIPVGKTVGLIGATGAGKSSILALLYRMYEPQKGVIYLDGVDINSVPLTQLRSLLGYIQQDGGIFEGTIAENFSLGLGNLNSNLEPSSVFGDCTRDATQLSAGEKQWLVFQRTRSRNPLVWVLDEAASSLDPTLDSALHSMVQQDGLKEDDSQKTVIIVAHRLSSVRSADIIIVLHQGKVFEQGSHSMLVMLDGLYKHLISTQEQHEAR